MYKFKLEPLSIEEHMRIILDEMTERMFYDPAPPSHLSGLAKLLEEPNLAKASSNPIFRIRPISRSCRKGGAV